MTQPSERFKRSLTVYAFVLAGVITAAVGVFLVIQDRKLSARDILAAVGLNLLASVVFAGIFSFVSNRIQERIHEDNILAHDRRITRQINQQFNTLRRDLHRQISSVMAEYLPAEVFPPTTGYDKKLNRALSLSLSQSRNYYFRGRTAKYVPARIKNSEHRPLQTVKVAMIDPNSQTALRFGVSDRRRQQPNITGSDQELIEALRNEALMSIVALFDCRHFCEIDIGFIASNGVTRVELFDDSVFISRYRESAPAYTFPETARFQSGSFVYDYNRAEIQRLVDVTERRIHLDYRCTETKLCVDLSDLLGYPVAPTDIRSWREAHAASIADFAHLLHEEI